MRKGFGKSMKKDGHIAPFKASSHPTHRTCGRDHKATEGSRWDVCAWELQRRALPEQFQKKRRMFFKVSNVKVVVASNAGKSDSLAVRTLRGSAERVIADSQLVVHEQQGTVVRAQRKGVTAVRWEEDAALDADDCVVVEPNVGQAAIRFMNREAGDNGCCGRRGAPYRMRDVDCCRVEQCDDGWICPRTCKQACAVQWVSVASRVKALQSWGTNLRRGQVGRARERRWAVAAACRLQCAREHG